jgi:hypothetical protein
MRAYTLMTLALVAPAACSASDASDCESARTTVVSAEISICATPEYANSKFCSRCVDSSYYSTTGASVCQCAPLTFDANACSYATGDDATAQVRSAIDWADSVCADFTPPAAIPPLSEAGPATASDAATE